MNQTTIPINESLSTQIKDSISGDIDTNFLSICENSLINGSSLTFESYLNNIKQNSTTSACSKCYKSCSLAFKCIDCQNFEDSVLCLECFLNGHHEGHNSYQILTKFGTCDCGNPAFIKPTGFCSQHKGEFADNELNDEEKSKLFTIFDTLLFEITHSIPQKSPKIQQAFHWMTKLASCGDTPKRCLALAFVKNEIDFDILQFRLTESVNSNISAYNDLIMSLANDPVFLRFYTKSIILFLPNYIRKLCDLLLANPRSPIDAYSSLQSNFFLAFTPIIHDVLLNDNIDWYNIFYNTTDRLLDFFKELCKYEIFSKMNASLLFEHLMTLAKEGLKVCLLKKDDQTITNFIKRLPNSFIKYEALFHFMRQVEIKIDDFTKKSEIALCIHNIYIDLIKEMYELRIYDDYPFEQLIDQINRLAYQPCSVLSPESVTIPFFPLHILAYYCVLRKKVDVDEFVLNQCQQRNITVESLIDIPLKYLASANLSRFDLFVRNSDAYITTLESGFFKRSIPRNLVPSFAMVQLFFGIEENKNNFLKDVATIFGLYQRETIDEDLPTQSNIEFCAILFICCLIFDRYCIFNDLIGIKRLIVISQLKKEGAINMEEIQKLLWGHPLQEKQFKEDLLSYATVAQTPNGSHLKLSHDLDWQPLLPFVKPNIVFEIFSKFTATNKNALVRFPEYTDLPFGLDTSEALTTPTLYAFEYHLLSQYVSKESTMAETLQLLFNLLIKTKEITKSELNIPNYDDTGAKITADDMITLMNQLPLTFPEFMNVKISYKNREPLNMIDMIKQCNPLGFTVLDRLDVKYELPQEVDQTIKKARKSKAKAVQDNIIAQFKQQQDQFASNNDEVELTDECPICLSVNEENPVLVFPISTFHTMIPIFVNNKLNDEIKYKNPNKSTYQRLIGFHLCGHFFHKTCIAQFDQKHFKCPIDRCLRNNFLPKIEKKFNEPLTEKEIEANDEFINRVFKNESLNTIIHSVTGELSLLEVRFRSRPEILDRSTNRILFHYLFVSLWNQFHESSKQYTLEQPNNGDEKIKPILKISPLLSPTQIHRPHSRLGTSHMSSSGNVSRNDDDDDLREEEEFNDEFCEVASMEFLFGDFDLNDDPVAIVLFKLLQSDNPLEGYNDLVKTVFNERLKDDSIPFELKYQFLRRVALFQHFALDLSLSTSSFIDWDDLLSFDSLIDRYQIELEGNDQELPLFSFIQMPKSFISFYLPPYSIKQLDDETKDIGICLLTGEVVNLKGWVPGVNENGDSRINGITQFQEFRATKMCNTFSICLALTGKNSSIPFILDQSFKKKAIPMKSFYVDSFGNEDQGQKHGDILTISEQKLENMVETLLSSDWIDQMSE